MLLPVPSLGRLDVGDDGVMRIARIFPTKTSMSPVDEDVYFGAPDLFTSRYDEIHISVTFTWDIPKAKMMANWWQGYGRIKIGGVAINGESIEPMIEGKYLKKGITITSRGCPKECWFCMVRKSKLIELEYFPKGNIIQDNNILSCSERHLDKVFSMLKTQKQIEFKGGLDKRKITPDIAQELKKLRIKSLWLASDSTPELRQLEKAINILRDADFKQDQIFCYALCGFDMADEEKRMRKIFQMGALPFAQLYRNTQDDIRYSKEWRRFQRRWCRPAIIKSYVGG